MRTFATSLGAAFLLVACSGGGGTLPGTGDGGPSSSSSSSTSSGATSTSSGATSTSSGVGGSLCDWTSKCPSEKAPTEQERATCRTELNGPCGPQYQAFGACFIQNETCTSSGKSDGTAIGNACANEVQAYSTCRQGQSSSGSSGSSGG